MRPGVAARAMASGSTAISRGEHRIWNMAAFSTNLARRHRRRAVCDGVIGTAIGRVSMNDQVSNPGSGEKRFQLLVDAIAGYAIFMIDPDGIVISWNAGAQRIKGYSRDEVLGRHFSMFFTPEDQATGRPARGLERATRTGRFEDEGWRQRKDGSRF